MICEKAFIIECSQYFKTRGADTRNYHILQMKIRIPILIVLTMYFSLYMFMCVCVCVFMYVCMYIWMPYIWMLENNLKYYSSRMCLSFLKLFILYYTIITSLFPFLPSNLFIHASLLSFKSGTSFSPVVVMCINVETVFYWSGTLELTMEQLG